jgi:hypothetical protein
MKEKTEKWRPLGIGVLPERDAKAFLRLIEGRKRARLRLLPKERAMIEVPVETSALSATS